MKNYLNPGITVTYTNAGSTIASGGVVDLDSRIGIAENAIPSTHTGRIYLDGVFQLPADTTFTAGTPLYWDGSKLTDSATGNTPAGVAVDAEEPKAGQIAVRLQSLSPSADSGGSGANTTLSNLGTTAINSDLLFADDGLSTKDIRGPDTTGTRRTPQISIIGGFQSGSRTAGTISVQAGNATGPSNAGGGVVLTAGSSAGGTAGDITLTTQGGNIRFNDGSTPSAQVGSVWTSTANDGSGKGAWQAPAFDPAAIGVDLLTTDGTQSLGDASGHHFSVAYISASIADPATNAAVLAIGEREIYDTANTIAMSFDVADRTLWDASGGRSIDFLQRDLINASGDAVANYGVAGFVLSQSAFVPTTASDTGQPGQLAWDADYFYVCTDTDTWKRTALATW